MLCLMGPQNELTSRAVAVKEVFLSLRAGSELPKASKTLILETRMHLQVANVYFQVANGYFQVSTSPASTAGCTP